MDFDINHPPEAIACAAKCPECGAGHTCYRFEQTEEVCVEICESCDSRKCREEQQAERRERRKKTWSEEWTDAEGEVHQPICPRLYRHFQPEKFTGDQAKLDKALEWEFGVQGLMLYGASGQGKTWAAFLIGHREHVAGRSVRVLNGDGMRSLATTAAVSASTYSAEIQRSILADLLILNDPFKAKMTDKVEEALWAIVDQRYEWERPIILTMNGTPTTILPILSSDRGNPLFRRLRESSMHVYFSDRTGKEEKRKQVRSRKVGA